MHARARAYSSIHTHRQNYTSDALLHAPIYIGTRAAMMSFRQPSLQSRGIYMSHRMAGVRDVEYVIFPARACTFVYRGLFARRTMSLQFIGKAHICITFLLSCV